MLMQGRGKMQIAGVVSLQKLLVREKAGQDSRGIYLISSNPADPEMFELKVHKPKDKQVWIQAIREAVQKLSRDEEDTLALTSEERQNIVAAKQNQVRHLVGLLRQKDIEQALLLEEKMSLQLRLLAAAGLDPPSPPSYRHLVSENADTGQMWKEVLTAFQSDAYVSPILPKRAETFGGFDNCNQGPFKLLGKKLSMSGTTAGTPDLDAIKPGDARLFYYHPFLSLLILFKERLPYRNCVISGGPLLNGNTVNINTETQNQQSQQQHLQHQPEQQLSVAPDVPALLSLGREQQYAAIQLSHYVYTLLCIISQLMTTNESLQAQMATLKGGVECAKQYRHNQQLEELRNLQDRLSGGEDGMGSDKRPRGKGVGGEKGRALEASVRAEQEDITQQRELLYRKMEVLTSQGLLISPNVAIPVTGLGDDSSKETSEDSSPQSDTSSTAQCCQLRFRELTPIRPLWLTRLPRQKEEKILNGAKVGGTQAKTYLPLNLISATNQQKVQQNVSIKQQIPLKLVSRLSSGSDVLKASNSGGIQQMLPLKLSQDEKRETDAHWHRHLVRLAPTQCQSPGSAKATRITLTQNFQKKFKVQNDQPPLQKKK
ncbi:hypothetical protein NQ317_010492 [Molorchus minor]|uniref:PH domain-containing protein n=1 Tax=Molorchus minor TaxID=1323400 RepID=A0ABQ9JZR8_9CUCU|nr:hypothetical protein NQ317_010492 [Molorchus minor]